MSWQPVTVALDEQLGAERATPTAHKLQQVGFNRDYSRFAEGNPSPTSGVAPDDRCDATRDLLKVPTELGMHISAA